MSNFAFYWSFSSDVKAHVAINESVKTSSLYKRVFCLFV